jgi:hypothetical protein
VGSSCARVSSSNFAAGGDSGVVVDGALADVGGALAADSSSCQPADVETYVPGPYHPAAAAYQGACTADQIREFYDDCFGPDAGTATCAAFSSDAGTSACAACILTPDTASTYGPLVDHHGTFITSNVAGCIQLILPGDLSCATAEAALVGCELAACEANCPVSDSATRAAYDACTSQADGAGCQSYGQMASCVQSLEDAGPNAASPVENCSLPFDAFYQAVVPIFCGRASTDAGVAAFDAEVLDATSVDAFARDATPADASLPGEAGD